MKFLAWAMIVLLAVPTTIPIANAADDLQRRNGAEPFRQQLDSLIDEYQDLMFTAPVHADLIRQLESARVQLAAVSDGEFEALAPQLSGQLQQLRVAIRELRAAIASPTDERVLRGVGFPDAPYPEVSWLFAIEGFTEVGDPPNGEVGATEGGFCSYDNSPSPNDQFLQLNLVLAAEAARETASRVCGIAEDLPLPASLVALACIVTDLLYIVAKGIVENENMCSSFMTDAEVTASYRRTGHLHGDLTTAESNLLTHIGTAETQLNLEVDANEGLLIDLDADLLLHDQNLTARADWIMALLDAQEQFLTDQRAENLRNHIERRLSESDNKPVAFFLLPDAHGGKVELVRQIVEETIANAAAGGANVQQAEGYLADADAAIVQGAFKDAYDLLGRAYRGAVQ